MITCPSKRVESTFAERGRPLCDPACAWTASVFMVLAHEYL